MHISRDCEGALATKDFLWLHLTTGSIHQVAIGFDFNLTVSFFSFYCVVVSNLSLNPLCKGGYYPNQGLLKSAPTTVNPSNSNDGWFTVAFSSFFIATHFHNVLIEFSHIQVSNSTELNPRLPQLITTPPCQIL